MLKESLEETAIKATGGAITYGGSYIVVHTVLTVQEVSEIATIVATCMTALYFLAQFLYTLWKWRNEANTKKKR